jgi:serine protease Do
METGMRRPMLLRAAIAAAVLAAGATCARSAPASRGAVGATASAPVQARAAEAPLALATAPDFAAIVERYGPAVVNITVTSDANRAVDGAGTPGLAPGDPMWEFFRRFGPGLPRAPEGGALVRGQGSGFIVSPDGMILTNAHVVADAQEVRVKLTDRREFNAKVVGFDKVTDVALLRIDVGNLPTVKLGDPAAVRVGDPVLAIGAPFGFENTATSGIVSAKSRTLPDETYVPFIQTDVAVNPGNSGGPLFNGRGEVIGINSQIYSRTGGYQGLSFAIPIDVATKVQRQLARHGKVIRGRLGVTIQEVDQALADAFHLARPQGALVSSVEPGSAAHKAGLKSGDVILALDGTRIEHSGDLPARVADMKPGTRASFEVLRDGRRMSLNATLGAAVPMAAQVAGDRAPVSGRLGMAVRPLGPGERSRMGLQVGLIVEEVSGAAARAGIQSGDVILAVNGVPAKTVEQLRALLVKAQHNVALLVQREGARIFVPIELG